MPPPTGIAPPYVAVIFRSVLTDATDGYDETAERMEQLAAAQPGYLGIESVRDPATGAGITVSYWRTEQAAAAWKGVAEHLEAQRTGRRRWYASYTVEVATVTRSYAFERTDPAGTGGSADGSGGAPSYSFGTGVPAVARLDLVARVFEPTMASVLAELPGRRWPTVVDLGCGPGASPAQLLGHLDAGRVVGLDASPAFLDVARRRVPGASFALADVVEPWPVVPPSLAYARFVLSHLVDPVAVVGHWRRQLAPGGVLVVEEPERIDTGDATLRRYLDLATATVASRGATMLVGPALAGSAGEGAVVDRTVTHRVEVGDAAAMFRLNLASLRHDPWVRDHHRPDDLDRLDRALGSAASAGGDPVTWHVRQLVLTAP